MSNGLDIFLVNFLVSREQKRTTNTTYLQLLSSNTTKIRADDSSLSIIIFCSIKTVVHLQKSRKKTTTTTEKKETRRGLQRRLRGARTTRLAASSSVAFVVSQAAAAVARRFCLLPRRMFPATRDRGGEGKCSPLFSRAPPVVFLGVTRAFALRRLRRASVVEFYRRIRSLSLCYFLYPKLRERLANWIERQN